MMCERPILLHRYKNKRKSKFLKDSSIDIVKVPCGKCEECLKKKRQQWAFRIMQDVKYSLFSNFVTLTYDDEHYESEKLNSDHPRKLFKFLRNHFRNEEKHFKYLCVGEHGDAFGRCHWHIIFSCYFSISFIDFMTLISNAWPYGNVFFGSVTIKSAMYVAKYCIKDLRDQADKDIVVLISKNIGAKWIALNRDYLKRNLILYGVEEDGKKVSLPRCWKNKIFSRPEYDEALDYFLLSLDDEDYDARQDYYNRKLKKENHEIYINTKKQKLIK